MKWTAYNSKGKLTWFGLPMWAETCLSMAVCCVFAGILLTFPVFGSGCGETKANQPPVPPSKYRVVQVYGANQYGTEFKAYGTDSVLYEGPWVKFYDKAAGRWIRISGTILVEGGD